MSEQELAQEQAQNAPQESVATPETTQQPEIDTSKIFSKGYNEGKSKAEKDLISRFSSLGIENPQSIEDVINHISGVISPKREEQSEVDQLRKMLEDANKKAEDAKNEYEIFRQETLLEAQLEQAMSTVRSEGQLSIKDDHLKNLFYMEYEVEEQGGQFFAIKDGMPILDNEGNRKSLANVVKDFVRENNYLRPAATGTGGSAGSVSSSDKPSRKEFNQLIQSKSADSQRKAAELYSQYKKVGSWGA